jgi:hypothetical protein
MGARNTLLTHFSNRYPHVAPRSEAKAPGDLALAMDGTFLRIGDMWKMSMYAPVIKSALAAGHHTEEDDVVAQTVSW